MTDLDILYEDDDIMVCYKPAGVATQTKNPGIQDMESLLKNYRARKKEPPYIGIVHRLDQPVEGVMVFAKNQKAAAELSKQVRDRAIGKYYYAVVKKTEGFVLEEQGILTDYVLSDERSNVSKIVAKDTPMAKKAQLEYQVIGQAEDVLCVEILLHTGRHHQIRVQFANAGAPLLGDIKYGTKKNTHLALCSYRIEFRHPRTKESMKFKIMPKGLLFGRFLDNIGNMA